MVSNFCFFKEQFVDYSWSSIFPTSLVMSSGTTPQSRITMSKSMHILSLLIHVAKLSLKKVVLNYLPFLSSWACHFLLLAVLHIIYLTAGRCPLPKASSVLHFHKRSLKDLNRSTLKSLFMNMI